MVAAYHDHYIYSDKGGYSRREWDVALASNNHPLSSREEEALVQVRNREPGAAFIADTPMLPKIQLLAVGLAHERTRKSAAEDTAVMAAALRCVYLNSSQIVLTIWSSCSSRFRHPGNHFNRMLAEVSRWTAALDNPTSVRTLLEFVVVRASWIQDFFWC